MNSEGGDSLETKELPELADMELDEFKDTLREKDVGQIDLEELVREERKGENRQKFLDFMVRHARELEVKNSLESLLASISDVDESLENIVEKDKERRLGADPEEITEKTVKDLRNYLKEHYLTADQLEKILEAEKEGKDRKTAKKFVKREIRNTESPDNTQKILKNLEYTEDSIRKFKKDFIQNPDHFNLNMFDNPLEDVLNENIEDREDSKESGEPKDLSELIGLTEDVIEVLEDVDNFRDREIIEKLANKALLALEAEKYDTFREKIERIQEIGFEERKSSSKLDEVEEAINRLEGNFNEEKGSAENRSQRKTELMEILETKGFERSELRKKSTADLEELLESSKNIETLESAFKQAEEENHEEEGENDEESSEEDESEPGENLDAELRGLEKSLKSTDL